MLWNFTASALLLPPILGWLPEAHLPNRITGSTRVRRNGSSINAQQPGTYKQLQATGCQVTGLKYSISNLKFLYGWSVKRST
jgi:hypothetical protein